MPEPIEPGRRYLPGLDGLRAVAVLGVIGYHLGLDAVPGGLLGVSVFFTLSGYLITDLLLSQHRSGDFTLAGLWFARARRLLPAMVLRWVNVKTIATSGSWRSEVMPPWNEALPDACRRHRNLRVYDWAADVRDEWFDTDGIHQDGDGYVERARLIPAALATAFPGSATPATPTAGEGCSFDL